MYWLFNVEIFVVYKPAGFSFPFSTLQVTHQLWPVPRTKTLPSVWPWSSPPWSLSHPVVTQPPTSTPSSKPVSLLPLAGPVETCVTPELRAGLVTEGVWLAEIWLLFNQKSHIFATHTHTLSLNRQVSRVCIAVSSRAIITLILLCCMRPHINCVLLHR